MTAIKQKIEQYFIDSWHGAPFIVQGQEINSQPPFMVISFIPIDREKVSYGGTCAHSRDTAAFKIECYETNPTKCLILEDSVKAFLECYNIDSIRVAEGKPDGLGIIDLENHLFQSVLLFTTINE